MVEKWFMLLPHSENDSGSMPGGYWIVFLNGV